MKLFFLAVAASTISLASATTARADTYWARATKAIPAGTVMTPANIAVIAVKDNDTGKIPLHTMWLTSPDDVYGFAPYKAVAKGDPVAARYLTFRDQNNLTPLASDPLWLKYAKASIVCDKRHDFAKSRQYEDGAMTELEHLGKGNQRLIYKDQAYWIDDMLRHSEELKSDVSTAKNQLGKMSNADDLQRSFLFQAHNRLIRSSRAYEVLSKVLPPKCMEVRHAQDSMEENKKNIYGPDPSHEI